MGDAFAQTDKPASDWKFRLYIAGGAPHSERAIDNLQRLCQEYVVGPFEIELVDILQQPLRAFEDQVLVTPTLVRLQPGPKVRLMGDLSDSRQVLLSLGLVRGEHESTE
ncbi:MAG: circadian clock KaiB family protein [Chloroflexota bacterium]